MTVRLCYSPKAYVFTKNSAENVFNITDYVTSGQVQRLINQASSANITLRNPDKIFTKPRQPTFHPMDAITIYLERIRGYPIQVFTGYLDDTPYYQMFPGTVTLQATCTLKRLMYTYFDPSLPYVNSFFEYYGWMPDGQGALYNTSSTAKGATTVTLKQAASGNVNLQDGSLGKLLYATLTDIGNWDDANIYIEDIPSGENGLAARIATLTQNLVSQERQAAQELTQFLDATIGSNSQGSGSGGSATSGSLTGNSNAEKIYNFFKPKVGEYGAAGIVGNLGQEVGGNSLNIPVQTTYPASEANNDSIGFGIAQWTPPSSGPPSGSNLETQLNFLWNGSKSITSNGGLAAQLRAATSATEAATIYCNVFEEPGDPNCMGYPVWLSHRIALAEQAYTTFHNRTSVSGDTSGSTSTSNNTGPRGTQVAGGSVSFTNPNLTANSTGSLSKGDTTTVADAIKAAANAINSKNYPYVWGGGHQQIGVASTGDVGQGQGANGTNVGFDCSGSVSAVLGAAQLISSPAISGNMESALGTNATSGPDPSSSGVNIYYNSTHTFMEIDGQYWGTWDGASVGEGSNGGPGWNKVAAPSNFLSQFSVCHIKQNVLNQTCKYSLGVQGSSTINGTGNSSSGTVMTKASAEAFTAELNFPSIQDMNVAIMLGSVGNGLMHDQQLMPFVQQLTNASLRQFQSLPNGDFYAFYPDYFGEFDQHPAYWEIDDLEMLSGDIYLSDSALVTHQYVIGDNTFPSDSGLYNELFSTGVITIYNAFQSGMGITGGSNDSESAINSNSNSTANIMNKNEAIEFVKRYGARPQVSQYPMVRSSLYEMFLAYQMFMVAWANQFRTTFNFTFMPEVYPGGKISFPAHGIQMYVQSVTHSWDYVEGFTTDAVLTAPSQIPGTSNPDIPPDMVQALVKPVRDAAKADTTKPTGGTTQSGKRAAKVPAGAGGF